jgi:hypothetical protein
MNTTRRHGDPKTWGQEIARINARIDEFQVRFEAECQILRSTVDTQIEELRAAVRSLERDVAAARPDAYAQRIAAQLEELKRKGDAAYDLMQASLRGDGAQGEATQPAEPPFPKPQSQG